MRHPFDCILPGPDVPGADRDGRDHGAPSRRSLLRSAAALLGAVGAVLSGRESQAQTPRPPGTPMMHTQAIPESGQRPAPKPPVVGQPRTMALHETGGPKPPPPGGGGMHTQAIPESGQRPQPPRPTLLR
jgi:hypothetical protein